MMKKTTLLVTGLLISHFSPAVAGEWDVSTTVSLEARAFLNDPIVPNQVDGIQPSLAIEADLRWMSDTGKHEFVAVPFYRKDGEDNKRSHADLREGFYRYTSDQDWSLLVGASKVFWGTTESRHLVDVINQTDGVEDIDREDKLGQPMVQLSFLKDWGQVDLYVLPYFREQTFAGPNGRLNGVVNVDSENILFERGQKRDAVDYAVRYAHYFGDWDVGLSAFHGTSREPRLILSLIITPETELRQNYTKMSQVGVDLQYTKDAWLWKFEGIARDTTDDQFVAAVAGVEHTIYQAFDKPWDIGLLAEYLYDGRDEDLILLSDGITTQSPITPFENDVFIGTRWAFNDMQDSAILAGAIIDTEDQSTAVTVEAERRLGSDWKAELEGRLFFNVDATNDFSLIENDEFINFKLSRYF